MDPSEMRTVDIQRIPSSSGPEVIAFLTKLINHVYVVAESGMWVEGWQRTTETDMANLIAASQLVGAYVNGRLVGCARTEKLSEEEAEFGMLAVENSQRGTGIGRDIVRFVEQESREKGFKRMQLEILLPREWKHPSKELLKSWYTRLGYEQARVALIDEVNAAFAKMLVTPCDLVIYKKVL